MSEAPASPTNDPAAPEHQQPGLSDERLMLAFSQGSSEAFTELFHRYKQPVYGFFCRRLADPVNAEELTQETFFALLRAAARYEPRALFRTYLYAIGFKILRAHRRKAAFRAAFLGHRNSVPDPATQDATESGLWVRRAVERLDPLDREIVMLREFEQLSYAEIADLLQLPLNTVRSRLFRARTALRDLLEPSVSHTTNAAIQPNAPPSLEENIVSSATKTHFPLATVRSGRLLRARSWSWRRWVLTLAAAGCASLLLLAISIPNLLRSKMAAHEDGPIARQRAMETARGVPVDITGHAATRTIYETKSNLEVSRVPLAEHGRNSVGGVIGAALGGRVSVNGPMIARTVSLSIVAKDFDAGRASLDTILARHNGYAANLNVTTPQGAVRTLQASLRIPAPQLPATLNELKSLGRVEAETQNGEEVTQQHADLVARLKNSRETEMRLQDVLRTRTGKVKDVLEVEEEIARVRGEIEQMEAEQKTLEHRVDFATIDLKLAEEYQAQLNTPAPSVLMQLRNASINGFRNAFQSLLALVLFLAESGPSLLLWLALLGVPAWRLWRRYRRAQSLGSLAGA